jgi:hypothetical protein
MPEVLTVVVMKSSIFLNVKPRNPLEADQRFRENFASIFRVGEW